jgi:aspartate/methionine/tyrosine aminotransferase
MLETGTDGVVAVHSLSKRSNLAGVRAGFYAGDAELVGYLADVRRHAGLMVPGPVQDAAVVARGDDLHVDEQRARYRQRLEFLAAAFGRAGWPAGLPDGGFYLWVPVPPDLGDGWGLATVLARRAGLLVSPGEFYGPAGAAFVRVAAVQPMSRLELVFERLVGEHRDAPAGAG